MGKFIEVNKANLQDIDCGFGCSTDLWRVEEWFNNLPTVDAVPLEQFNELKVENNVLKRLINGEWVDCKDVEKALGIDFATGLKIFDFSRTVEWNPYPLNGQKITTRFRLKRVGDQP